MAAPAQSIERLLRNPVSGQTGRALVKVVPLASRLNHGSPLD
jgi:hypothetical protein